MKKYFVNLAVRELKRYGHDVSYNDLKCKNCGFEFEVSGFDVRVLPNHEPYLSMTALDQAISKFAGLNCQELLIKEIIE